MNRGQIAERYWVFSFASAAAISSQDGQFDAWWNSLAG
jgi:hypothetical protein